MKKILNICAVVSIVLLAISCNRKVEFEHSTFVTFSSVKYNVEETVGTISLPVILYNATGEDVQVSVAVDAKTAEEGTDFNIVNPSSGLLTFTGQTDTLYVDLEINAMVGEFTGAKAFSLSISSLTDGVTTGNFATADVTIIDLDHPLSQFVGEWAGTLMFASNPPTPLSTVLKISIDANDPTYTQMIIEGWEAHPSYSGYAVPVTAVYDPSVSPNVRVLTGQTGWYVNDYYNFIFTGLDESGSSMTDLELAYDPEAATLTQLNMFGAYNTKGADEDLGFYSLYQPGAVFTKK